MTPTCIELCAGAGGMAMGLERAGWEHLLLVERDEACCETLRTMGAVPGHIVHSDIQKLDHTMMRDMEPDMICGGPPCQPFSSAGDQRGGDDPRDALECAVRLAVDVRPRMIMFENVPGLLHQKFNTYRDRLGGLARDAGYAVRWIKFNCRNYGVPQRRNRIAFLAILDMAPLTDWPPLPPHTKHTQHLSLIHISEPTRPY